VEPQNSVETYLAALPAPTREVVDRLRGIVRGVLPDADEVISYSIPTFRVNGRNVVHVAGWAKHTSMYPLVDLGEEDEAQVARFRSGRGTLKFPLDEPLPEDLIVRLVRLLAERAERRGPGRKR
jgi:uncharacterized protein YdhG (YjbR/CyaY superfamily)